MVNSLPAGAPNGWEGRFAFPIASVADFKKWLNHVIKVRDHLLPLTPVGKSVLGKHSDGVAIRNAYRIIDMLDVTGMPDEPTSYPSAFTIMAETTLLKGIRRKLNNPSSVAQVGAEIATIQAETKMEPAHRRAYVFYKQAVAKRPDLECATYEAVYAFLINGSGIDISQLTKRDTFKRQLGEALKAIRGPKNTPRRGRKGRSVVGAGQDNQV